MFGHDNHDNNDDQQHNDHNGQAPVATVTAPSEPPIDDGLGLSDESASVPAPTAPNTAPASNGFTMDPITPAAAPATPSVPAATTAPATSTMPIAGGPTNDLLHIKQQALQHLSPLLGHLDQTPEEKFRTTMMMIQASDDQTIVSQAYIAAQAIPDEKVRAQALLDIVNEINYFTQQQHKPAA